MKLKPLIFFCLLLTIFSCKTADVNYLQNIENIAIKTSIDNSKTKFMPGDAITLNITAKDMEVVKPFVQSGNAYIVDTEGNINVSTLGRISALGKTSEELREDISNKLKQFIKEPIVTVGLTNFKVTVLGEVNKPGSYPVQEQANLFSALGLAGDLTIYGERKNVLLVRNNNGEITKQIIDLTDANFINSPYYFLKQNDVIYISANRAKANSSKYGSETSIYITVGSIIISVLLTVITLVKN